MLPVTLDDLLRRYLLLFAMRKLIFDRSHRPHATFSSRADLSVIGFQLACKLQHAAILGTQTKPSSRLQLFLPCWLLASGKIWKLDLAEQLPMVSYLRRFNGKATLTTSRKGGLNCPRQPFFFSPQFSVSSESCSPLRPYLPFALNTRGNQDEVSSASSSPVSQQAPW